MTVWNRLQISHLLTRGVLICLLASLSQIVSAYSAEWVVAEVRAGSEASAAGLAVGDRLDTWQLRENGESDTGDWKEVDGALHVRALELQQRGRQIVHFQGSRNGALQRWQLLAGDWGLNVRPTLDNRHDDTLLKSCNASIPVSVPNKLESLRALQSSLRTSEHADIMAWLSACVAAVAGRQQATLQDDLRAVKRAAEARNGLDALYFLTRANYGDSTLESILPAVQAATPHWQTSHKPLRDLASARYELARFEVSRGELDAGLGNLEAVRASIGESMADSVLMVRLDGVHGDVLRARGDLTGARAAYLQARDGLQALSGATARIDADVTRDLGTVAAISGDLDEAEALYDRALQLIVRHGETVSVGALFNNLGIVNARRGDMTRAEFYFQRALTIYEQHEAWMPYTRTMFNLADIAYGRSDFATSEQLSEKLVTSFLRLSPNSPDLALSWIVLAHSQFELGKYDAAEANYRRAIELYTDVAPNSPDLSGAYLGLGDIAYRREDFATARDLFVQATDMRERVAPQGILTAEAYQFVAKATTKLGDLDKAQGFLEAALSIQENIAPGSVASAESFYALAQLAQARKDTKQAIHYFEAAVTALETQTRRLGGADDSRSLFSEHYSVYFKEYGTLLWEAGQHERAFDVLERYRARSLLGMLAERESSLARSLPQSIAEDRMAREQAYNEARAALVDLSNTGVDDATLTDAQNRVLETKIKRDGFSQRLRAIAGSFANLRYPKPISSAMAQQLLEPDTVVVAYSVGDEDSLIFEITHETLRVHPIPIGARELSAKVKRFGYLIDAGRIDPTPSRALNDLGQELHHLLLGPLQRADGAKQLLLLPDGPLHYLPFSALVVAPGRAGEERPRYLIEQASLHYVLSLTLYNELRERSDATHRYEAVVAFADPSVNSTGPRSGEAILPSLEHASRLPRLPHTRDETAALASVFGSAARTYVGDAASEEAFRRESASADVLHVATHAIANESAPMDSAIILSLSGSASPQTDGLLHTWEIFEYLQMQDALVVLSACQSGWGKAASGEGLLGLAARILVRRRSLGCRFIVENQRSLDQSTHERILRTAGSGSSDQRCPAASANGIDRDCYIVERRIPRALQTLDLRYTRLLSPVLLGRLSGLRSIPLTGIWPAMEGGLVSAPAKGFRMAGRLP